MSTTRNPRTSSRREQLHQQQHADALAQAKRRRTRRLLGALAAVIAVVIIVLGLWSARPKNGATSGTAPQFSLTTTAGTTVSLSDYRGRPVLLYFNEGAGCGACTQQMATIEKDPAFQKSGITVLPIVMNTKAQIQPDLDTYGVKTPYLLDDGTVSKAYDTLGKGMHADLPGHGFVLIDKSGNKVWQGDYPSMWIDPHDLLTTAKSHLSN